MRFRYSHVALWGFVNVTAKISSEGNLVLIIFPLQQCENSLKKGNFSRRHCRVMFRIWDSLFGRFSFNDSSIRKSARNHHRKKQSMMISILFPKRKSTKLSFSTQPLRTKTSGTVNSKSISARRYSSCDDENESLGPDLNRKLWLHKFPLISLAYFAINCTFFAINNSFTYPLLEVSSYTMNNGCVCCRSSGNDERLALHVYFSCCCQHYAW